MITKDEEIQILIKCIRDIEGDFRFSESLVGTMKLLDEYHLLVNSLIKILNNN